MPYTVPEGFFDTLEQDVLAAVATEKSQLTTAKSPRYMFRSMLAAAAGLALILVFTIYNKVYDKESHAETSFVAVEKAFCNLALTDQDYLIEAYQDDMFLQDAVADEAQ